MRYTRIIIRAGGEKYTNVGVLLSDLGVTAEYDSLVQKVRFHPSTVMLSGTVSTEVTLPKDFRTWKAFGAALIQAAPNQIVSDALTKELS